MNVEIISIIALVILCVSVICTFFKKDIFKSVSDNIWLASGFVVSCVSLYIIYIVNR